MSIDEGNLDDIIMDLQLQDLNDLSVLPKFHEFPESQLCVPPDPIHDLEWFPSFSDDFISFNQSSLIEYCCNTPEHHEKTIEKKDWVGISEAKLGGFTKKKARTKKKKKKSYLEGNYQKENIKGKKNIIIHVKKRCRHCETEETPQWRVGPMGPKTLCNACGVRFKSGRLVPEYRPVTSPTFDASRHSNYHKKILKRRGFS